MKKADLITAIAEGTGHTKTSVEKVFAVMDAVLKKNAAAGEETVLGLVTIKVVPKPARIGSNPKTGQKQEFPARNAIKVHVSKMIKDAANKVA